MTDLPTVHLIDGDLYWIKGCYTNPDRWTVAKWEVGYWWGMDGKQTTPSVISGPIPRPVETPSLHEPQSPTEQNQGEG
jgi:hypothetical protein